MFKRIAQWWERESLAHNRSVIERIFSGYAPMRREEELKILVGKWLDRKHIQKNPPRRLMGKGWGRSRHTVDGDI